MVDPARPRAKEFEPHLPTARDADGRWRYAPIGSVTVSPDGVSVVCHACGQHLQAITKHHLARHGLTLVSYRQRYGLNRTTSLTSPDLAQQRTREGRRRYQTNDALRAGLRIGQAMVADGTALAMSINAQPPGSKRPQALKAIGQASQRNRVKDSQAADRRRDQRAQELGYTDTAHYLAQRRRVDGAAYETLARELRTSTTIVHRLLATLSPTQLGSAEHSQSDSPTRSSRVGGVVREDD